MKGTEMERFNAGQALVIGLICGLILMTFGCQLESVTQVAGNVGAGESAASESPANRLEEIECSDPCETDYEPLFSPLDWIEGPMVTASGELTLVVKLDEDNELPFRNHRDSHGQVLDVLLTESYGYYGSVVPRLTDGTYWAPEPSLWVADIYHFRNRELTVRAQIDTAAATHDGLEVCIWTDAPEGSSDLLGCKRIAQP